MMRQELASMGFIQGKCVDLWTKFAVQAIDLTLALKKNCLWHIFCMIGLRPSNLRVGCREIVRNISMFGIKGA